jgi:hypothetical protein
MLIISPSTGSPGTSFTLTASGFLVGEAMTFEIDVPTRAPFIGPSHTADAQGTVTTTYTPLAGDPAGTYTIKAVGNEGTKAQSTLMVSGSATSSTTG